MNDEIELINKVFEEHDLKNNRMIALSKAVYLSKYAERSHMIAFNATIFNQKGGILWRGDIDLKHDAEKLENIAKKLNVRLFLLKETEVLWSHYKSYKDLVSEKYFWKSENPYTLPAKNQSFLNKIKDILTFFRNFIKGNIKR